MENRKMLTKLILKMTEGTNKLHRMRKQPKNSFCRTGKNIRK